MGHSHVMEWLYHCQLVALDAQLHTIHSIYTVQSNATSEHSAPSNDAWFSENHRKYEV